MGLLNAFLWTASFWFVLKERKCIQNRGQTVTKTIEMEQQNA